MGLQERIAPGVVSLPGSPAVLVVEDQPLVAATARDMIEMIGGTVAALASTIDDALDACRTVQFDCALLDVDLGGTDSVPVAAALERAGKPYLIVTGSDRLPPLFGGRPFLVKPYTLHTLRQALAAIVG